MSEKNTRVILRIEKREIKPKPSRCCCIRCPSPLLPAALSHCQTSSQSLLSPPRLCCSPSSATTARRCDSSGAAARRINVALPFPRLCSLVLSSRHCHCRRCCRCCKCCSLSLLPAAIAIIVVVVFVESSSATTTAATATHYVFH